MAEFSKVRMAFCLIHESVKALPPVSAESAGEWAMASADELMSAWQVKAPGGHAWTLAGPAELADHRLLNTDGYVPAIERVQNWVRERLAAFDELAELREAGWQAVVLCELQMSRGMEGGSLAPDLLLALGRLGIGMRFKFTALDEGRGHSAPG